MNTKSMIPEHLLKFPKYLPNDIEGFIFYYPNKFPGIIKAYEDAAEKYALDPEGFRTYGDAQRDELWIAFRRILDDYKNGDQDDLKHLVEIDQRLHKMFCYRFWIVNYLFADGPIHEFYVDMLKNSIRKFIDVTEEVEDFENQVLRIQRDLLQNDYADLYLRQALNGADLMDLFEKSESLNELCADIYQLIDENPKKNSDKINLLWEKLITLVKENIDVPINKDIYKALEVPLEQANFRKTMLPVYNMLTHAAEFRKENIGLKDRYAGMKSTIDDIFAQAKERLDEDEYNIFELSYQQARNFSMYKDVMGAIDPELLPMWFGIHGKIQTILKRDNPYLMPRDSGHATMFYRLVWFLPPDLKVQVMTPDFTPFDVNKV